MLISSPSVEHPAQLLRAHLEKFLRRMHLAFVGSTHILDCLPVIRRLQLDPDATPASHNRAVDLGADTHEWRQHRLARIAPQHQDAVDYVKLQRMDVLLIFAVARFAEREHPPDSYIIPKGARVLSPDPMRIAVLRLLADPAAILQHVNRRPT